MLWSETCSSRGGANAGEMLEHALTLDEVGKEDCLVAYKLRRAVE